MKKLFTLCAATFAAVTMSAQDATTWEKGQEITTDLEWTNTKYEGDNAGWTYYNAGGNGVGYFYNTEQAAQGSVEMFNNAVGSEYYQVMWLPAGYYKFTVQGFYRPGSAWSAGWDTNQEQNGVFFCDAVNVEDEIDAEGTITGVKYTTTRESNTMLRLLVSDGSEIQLLTDAMCGDWQRDSETSATGTHIWVPNSMWGASLHFATGTYENELMVVNPEDGYVKIGIRKGPDTIGDDWIIFDNFRAYYISDAGEAVQLMLAQEEVANAEKKLNDLMETIQEQYGALGGLLSDELMEISDADDYNSTVEGCNASVEKINIVIANYNTYLADAKKLTSLVEKCEAINAKANDPVFGAAIEAAKAVMNDGNGDDEMTIDAPEAYKNAEEALDAARLAYLTSAPAVDGAWDLTTMINFPWFCLPEYEPVWSEEDQMYLPNEAALATDAGTGDGSTWADKNDVNGTANNIAKGVNVNGKSDQIGVWYQSGTEGGGLEVYWNDKYTCIKKWDVPHEGYHDVSQRVVGLPNGFYKLKAFAQTWGNDWADNCRNQIYIKSSEMESFSPYLEPGGWWANDVYEWKELETEMIQVTDGEVIISSRDNGFATFTGFRLYFYGEEPNFNELLANQIQAAKESVETLLLQGDKAAVEAMVAQIPASIDGKDAFEATSKILSDINGYVNTANSFMSSWKAEEKFMDLQGNYAEDSEEFAILNPTWMYVLDYPSQADATYLGAQAIDKDYTAYENYMGTRAKMVTLAATNAELKAELDKQATAMKAAYVTSDVIAEYLEALAAPYNAAVIASMGEASEAKPADITTLIVNPNYDEGNTGWEGGFTVSGDFKNAESWNTSAFSASQTIYSLPAGTYRIQVQAFYRDGGDANAAFMNYVYNEAYTPNVKLQANGIEADIVSLASCMVVEPSMTTRIKEWVKDDIATDAYHDVNVNDPDYDPNKVIYAPVYEDIDMENPAYPFDQMIIDDQNYWYPNSMEGAMNRFEKNPDAYINTVEVYLSEPGNLTFGLNKEEGIGADWCIFDNWKLYYLGAQPTVGISSTAAKSSVSEIYSASGVRQNSLSRGINIVKMADGSVMKVINK